LVETLPLTTKLLFIVIMEQLFYTLKLYGNDIWMDG
jgi:hypothetical protein